MKLALGIFVLCAFGSFSVRAQDDIREITEAMLAAQADLSLGHRFFETAIYTNRAQISAYLYRINREIINSHINTYAYIKNLGLDTRAEIEGFETDENSQSCVDGVLARWNLQITRYGHRLGACVRAAHDIIGEMSIFVNDLHTIAQFSGNQVQNIGVSTLSHMNVFDGEEDIPTEINRNFRELLKVYLSYRTRFEGFLEEVSGEYLETIRTLISCDDDLSGEFKREIDLDLAKARGCVGDIGGEQTPAPLKIE